jgi:hypothetical protein
LGKKAKPAITDNERPPIPPEWDEEGNLVQATPEVKELWEMLWGTPCLTPSKLRKGRSRARSRRQGI